MFKPVLVYCDRDNYILEVVPRDGAADPCISISNTISTKSVVFVEDEVPCLIDNVVTALDLDIQHINELVKRMKILQARKLQSNGLSVKEVARVMKVSDTTIRRMLK